MTAVAALSITELFRRRDVYVALILCVIIAVPLSSVNLFGVEGIVRYLREVTFALIWLFSIIIGVTNAARQLPGEIQRRTVLPLLAKPIRRSEVVLGKFLGAAAAGCAGILLFYAFFVLLAGVKSGYWFSPVLLQALILHFCFIVLVTALCILGSVLLTPSANLTCSFLVIGGMFLFGHRLGAMMADAPGISAALIHTCHLFLPHFEFFDLRLRVIHEWEALPTGVFFAVVSYAVAYAAALLGAAVFFFNRKRV
jgi:ABC-type transport system involved in multi-copper enzyme maturation permease subunit